MIWYLERLLRLTIWLLLTADLSVENVAIGIVVVLALPGFTARRQTVRRDWVRAVWESIVAVPQAYKEAIEIMFRPHNFEETTLERVPPRRTPGLIFLDIFIITFTPKTIVTKYHERGWYEVHWIRRRKPE